CVDFSARYARNGGLTRSARTPPAAAGGLARRYARDMATRTDARKGAAAAKADTTLFTDDDLYLFNEGTHFRLYDKLGARLLTLGGVAGTYFAVWAPGA